MSFEEAYRACRDLLLDSYEVVEEVEKYRQDCRPKTVKVVLLAESHVHTTEKEFSKLLKKEYRHSDGTRCRYVRFVYCLGSSESQVLEQPELAKRRRGQFWRVLYSCMHPINSNSDFLPFDGVSAEERLNEKISLLGELKANGIWLVDASIVGINGLDREARDEIIQKCWETSVGQTLRRLKDLKQIIVIGETVHKALADELKEIGVNVDKVPQPQARTPGGYLPYYRKISDICQRYGVKSR